MRVFYYEAVNKWVPDVDPVVIADVILQNELILPSRKKKRVVNLIQQFLEIDPVYQNDFIIPSRKKKQVINLIQQFLEIDPVIDAEVYQNDFIRPSRNIKFRLPEQQKFLEIDPVYQSELIRPERKQRFRFNLIQQFLEESIPIEDIIVQNPIIIPRKVRFLLDFFAVSQDFPFPTDKAVFRAFTSANPQSRGGRQ